MWIFDQAIFALTLIQKWPYKNEVIDLHNKKVSNNYYIKSATFQIYSNKSHLKMFNILFEIKFRMNLEFQFLFFIKKISDNIGESNYVNIIQNLRSLISICTSIQKHSLK
jgi:hypothetical protein